MARDPRDPPKVNPVEARQGVIGNRIRWVLLTALSLAIIALIVAYFWVI